MMIGWWEHSQKGVTDGRTDRQTDGRTDRRTDWTIHRAAWSQLKIYFHNLSFLNTELPSITEIFEKDNDSSILCSQYHVCWWPGNKMSQDISSHDIDLVIPEYFNFRARMVTFLHTLTYLCFGNVLLAPQLIWIEGRFVVKYQTPLILAVFAPSFSLWCDPDIWDIWSVFTVSVSANQDQQQAGFCLPAKLMLITDLIKSTSK